ncbi:MAG: hypothetical protein JWR52_3005 [Marmoricola sp.]|nr:hypothetical protein [Marmoricola sp.]
MLGCRKFLDEELFVSEAGSTRNAPVWVTVTMVVVAVLIGVVAVVYFTTSAADLPSFFPGHAAGDTKHHIKHGIAAVLVALVALGGAWLTSGQKKS